MNFINNILPERIIYSLGWTVIHSFWQGALIALLLFAFITLINSSSAIKTKVFIIVLGLMTVSFLTTFSIEFASFNSNQPVPRNEIVLNPASQINTNEGKIISSSENSFSVINIIKEARSFLAENISLFTIIWFAGFIIFTVRFFGGLYLSKKLKCSGTSLVPAKWQNKVNSIRYRLKISKPVRLLESVKINIPIVIGYAKPVILMPLGMFSGMPEAQVEAIIAHELAHIYRNDYLINIIQSIAEIILFYHPVVWWVSYKIRAERENSCDDIAVSVCGSTMTFARALANLEEIKMENKQFALAVKSNKSLTERIKRILGSNPNEISFPEKTLSLVIIVALFMSATVLASVSFAPIKGFVANKYIPAVVDSSWKTGEYNFVNDNMKVKMKNGKIRELTIKGKKISEKKFPDYKKMVEDTLNTFNLAGPDIPASPPMLANLADLPEKAPVPVVALNAGPPNPPLPTEKVTTLLLPGTPHLLEKPNVTPTAPTPRVVNDNDSVVFPTKRDILTDEAVVVKKQKILAEQLKKLKTDVIKRQRKLVEINEDIKEKQIERTREMEELNEKMRRNEENLKQKSNNIKRNAEELKIKNEEFITGITKELVNRGIVSMGEDYNLKLSGKELIVNNKKQSDELLRIALALYKKAWGKDMKGDATYEINR